MLSATRRSGAGMKAEAPSLQKMLIALSKIVKKRPQLLLQQKSDSTERNLIDWVKRKGGQADVRIESPASGGPRGVLAERDFSANEVVMSIPEGLAIPFEGSPEGAAVLLLHLKHDRQRRQQYQPWLHALPGPEDFIAWDSVNDQDLSTLQCPEMEAAVRERRERLEAVWNEDGDEDLLYSRRHLLCAQNIHWDEVQWAANVVRSRNWTMGGAGSGQRSCVMMPLFDMVNHDRTSPNRIRYQAGKFELVHEGEGICAGDEITYSYEGHGHELRNDQAALDYCFMLPFSDDNRLFHVDALASTAASSEDAIQEMSADELEAERTQMQSILEDFPTSLAEDRELLTSLQDAGKSREDTQFLVEIRAARKEALKAHVEGIETHLQRRS